MTRGGARKGAGRKKGPALAVYTVKMEKEILDKAKRQHGRKLHKMVIEFIKGIVEAVKN